jgi:hypothetical protein
MSMKVQISKIKPNPNNPRFIKDDKFNKLVNSITTFPEMLEKRPLVCFTDADGKYVVLGGNMRLKASKRAGLKELPIILADDWSEEQKNEFIIKDNVGFGEWDWDDLANEWDIDNLLSWGLDLPMDLVDDEKEKNNSNSIYFKIECLNKNQLEDVQNKLGTRLDKLSYRNFLNKIGY